LLADGGGTGIDSRDESEDSLGCGPCRVGVSDGVECADAGARGWRSPVLGVRGLDRSDLGVAPVELIGAMGPRQSQLFV
jgi:hypothetical protein